MPVTHLSLTEPGPKVPFQQILRAWVNASFEPAACRAALEQLLRAGVPAELFDLDQIDQGGVVATPELLLGHAARIDTYQLSLVGADGSSDGTWAAGFETLPDMAEMIRIGSHARDVAELREALDGVDEEIVDLMCARFRPPGESPFGLWPDTDRPGIYRREHASLVVRTEGARLVTDPQALGRSWTTHDGRYPADRTIDAARVFVTHSHNDHYCLPSILRWAQPDEPVIVAPVPAPSLLAQDMRAALERAGQACAAPAWGSTFRAGDVEVEILPFYGEQPTIALPSPDPRVRNWGSCYRFDTPDYSMALLVDSGIDVTGTGVEAVRRSVARRGPIDVLMSCCLGFTEALNFGLPFYVLTVPFGELQRISEARRIITLGTDGVAEACVAAGARYFLPYAHGFRGLGRPPVSAEGGGQSEAQVVAALRARIAALGGKTEVLEWNPGDVARWASGRLEIEHVAAVEAKE